MFKSITVLATAAFVLCDATPIAKLFEHKCSVKDNECLEALYSSYILHAAEYGIPEMGIPVGDPLIIKNLSVQPLGLLNATIVDGAAIGLKGCRSTSYKNDIETGHSLIEVECPLFTLEGSYILESSPTLLALSSGINVHGKGKGSATIDKLKLKLDIAYEVKKHADCELYFELKPEESSYTYEVLGKVTLAVDSVFVGSQDVSTVTNNIVNENWKVLLNVIGKPFFEKAFEIFYENSQKLFDNVPTTSMMTEDLSSYVKN